MPAKNKTIAERIKSVAEGRIRYPVNRYGQWLTPVKIQKNKKIPRAPKKPMPVSRFTDIGKGVSRELFPKS